MNSPLLVGKWHEPAMNSPAPALVPAPHRNWPRRVVTLLVALVVVAVAAAAFVFSYDGVHAIALFGGVSKQLARYYPGLFDAVLVIACVAAVMLRDGPWWARLWAWVVVLVVLAAIGTTDVLHAMNYALARRPTEGIVAAAPVVAVLLAFSLLLALLRQSRTHAGEQAAPAPLDVPALPAAVPASPIALPPAAATAATGAMPAGEDWAAPRAAPAHEDRATTDAPQVPRVPAPEAAHSATETSEAIAGETASAEAPAVEPPVAVAPAVEAAVTETPAAGAPAVQDEPAPPTVQVPALSAEPRSAETAPARRPQGIRYAGNGVPGMAGKREAARGDVPPGEDYWDDTEDAGPFAGLVYPARGEQSDPDDPGDADDDAETGHPSARKAHPELDDDAPPFATAPFAPVPRLNRVRSTPAPPADEDEDEQPSA